MLFVCDRGVSHISIHAAREGGDCQGLLDAWLTVISIHAAREGGDGEAAMILNRVLAFQSTPPVKAATRTTYCPPKKRSISIHAAREGGDLSRSAWEKLIDISIHAAREGGDFDQAALMTGIDDFNPRRP